jgi:hypothetical protein
LLKLCEEGTEILVGLTEAEQVIAGVVDTVRVTEGTVQQGQDVFVVRQLAHSFLDVGQNLGVRITT